MTQVNEICSPLPPPRGIQLTTLDQHPCPYLPNRLAQNRAFLCQNMPASLYHELMDAGFRRSGTLFYQPICASCRECRPIRVPVDHFTPDKSQRRTSRRNLDLLITAGDPEPTREKFELYVRYCLHRHQRDESSDPAGFIDFLYESPLETIEFCYRDRSGRLLGVGLCDVCDRALSSVYFYFDPDQPRRGLGTFSCLQEIEYARQHGLAHYYLGFWVRACGSMSYKANFRPCEVLGTDGRWSELVAWNPNDRAS